MTLTHVARPPSRAAHRAPIDGRLWEIDCARTVAIAMMVSYHVVYDIDFLGAPFGPDPLTGWWGALPEATASSFLLLVGVTLAVTDARSRRRGQPPSARWRRHTVRSAKVLAAAMIVTTVTFIALPDRYVRFGILHAIAASTVLALPLLRLRAWNALIGAGVLAAGIAVRTVQSDLPGGLIVGLRPPGFATVDYWPLLPWFGVVLVGVALGSVLYPDGQRRRHIAALAARDTHPSRTVRIVAAPGRHSLIVYLAHQPVLIALLALGLLAAGVDLSWR